MLCNKCILSQSGTPDFQNFPGEHESPDSGALFLVVPFFGMCILFFYLSVDKSL
jgi:hypothetical protein